MVEGLWICKKCYKRIGHEVECYTDLSSFLSPICQHCFEHPAEYHIVDKDDVVNLVWVPTESVPYPVFEDIISLIGKLSIDDVVKLVGDSKAIRLNQWYYENRSKT